MDRDRSEGTHRPVPIASHEAAGVECCGCIVAAVEGDNVELRCNECGSVVGVIQIETLPELLGLEGVAGTCPHSDHVNGFQGFRELKAYVCSACGAGGRGWGTTHKRVEIRGDDGTRDEVWRTERE
jgi:hypothetical protein